MKAALVLGTVGALIALAFVFFPEKKIQITEFSWTIQGKTAPFSFHASNSSSEPHILVVVLLAENSISGEDGVKLQPIGRSRIEIELGPREEKTVKGVLQLTMVGTSATALSFYPEIK